MLGIAAPQEREEIFARQRELGVVPENAELTARPAEIPAWDEMPDELKPVLARQMEVYAGFMEHTDHHVGRLVDALEDLGILDDTLVYYVVGDNGASAEGTINGTFNEYFSLDVSDYVRPAAYAAVAANNAQGFQSFVLPALNVTGGKFDYKAWTGNLGATLKLSESSEIFGGFSQGFALPDVGAFTRRAGISTAFACPVANPNCLPANRRSVSYASIAPEAQIVNNYELGIRGSHGIFKGSLTGFISTSSKGVTFDQASNTISQQRERIWGVEATGDVQARRFIAGERQRRAERPVEFRGDRERAVAGHRAVPDMQSAAFRCQCR